MCTPVSNCDPATSIGKCRHLPMLANTLLIACSKMFITAASFSGVMDSVTAAGVMPAGGVYAAGGGSAGGVYAAGGV